MKIKVYFCMFFKEDFILCWYEKKFCVVRGVVGCADGMRPKKGGLGSRLCRRLGYRLIV